MADFLRTVQKALPKPILFGLYGALGGLLGALLLGEPLWSLLRPPPPPPAPPGPPLVVAASQKVELYPGGTNRCFVKIARSRCPGPVTIELADAPAGVSAAPLVIPAGQTEGELDISATSAAHPGATATQVTASGQTEDGACRTAETTQIAVLELKLLPPKLRLSVSPTVEAYQGTDNRFVVKIARDRFEEPVQLQVEGLPEGLTVAPLTIPLADTEAELQVRAGRRAAEGTYAVRVHGVAEQAELDTREALTIVVRKAAVPHVDVLFVVDVTGSMEFAIDGIRRGIRTFVEKLRDNQIDARVGLIAFRDRHPQLFGLIPGEAPEVLKFGSETFTDDCDLFTKSMRQLRADGGGDEPESSLDALWLASEQPFRKESVKVLLLVTDASPHVPDVEMQSLESVARALRKAAIDQLHLVCRPAHREIYEQVKSGVKEGQFFDIETAASGGANFAERILPEVSTAIVKATPASVPSALTAASDAAPLPPPSGQAKEPPKTMAAETPVIRGVQSQQVFSEASKGRLLLAISVWTGSFAASICLLIVTGQHFYLRQSLLPGTKAARGIAGGLAAGLVGGAIGQLPLLFLAAAPAGIIQLSQFLGWTMLGALAGLGMSFFIPNLRFDKGLLGGAVGGVVGGAGYLATAALLLGSADGDVAGRILGAVLVGFFIGLMVALTELAFRRVWLEIGYGSREVRTVTLGAEPVSIGADARACTIYAHNAPPVAFSYWFREGQVMQRDVATGQTRPLRVGDSHAVGSVKVTICGGKSLGAAPPIGPLPKAPPPPVPKVPAPPVVKSQPTPAAPSTRPSAPVGDPPAPPAVSASPQASTGVKPTAPTGGHDAKRPLGPPPPRKPPPPPTPRGSV